MKIYHFAISFAILALLLMTVTDVKIAELSSMAAERRDIDNVLDDAVTYAVQRLINVKDGSSTLDLEGASESFFDSLYASLAIADAPWERRLLEIYVPVLVVTDVDGFYVCSNDYTDSETVPKEFGRKWSNKYYYDYNDGQLEYRFTNTTEVTVYDHMGIFPDSGGTAGYRLDVEHIDAFRYCEILGERCPDSILLDAESFIQKRDEVIVRKIEEQLNFYCSMNNRIARDNGIEYEFSLPSTDGTLFLRTSRHVSLLAVFQGYPYFGQGNVYNRFCISNAQLRETTAFYLEPGERTYHRYGCSLRSDNSEVYYSKMDCALQGAFECPLCKSRY